MGKQGGQGKGKPKLKDKNFGKALIRQQINGMHGMHGTKTRVQPKMNSYLDTNPLDDFITMAEMNENDFEVTKVIDDKAYLLESMASNKALSEQFSTIQDSTENKKKKRQEMTTENFQQLQLVIPRKPKWHPSMSSEQVQRNEKNAFLQWRRNIAQLEQQYSYLLKLTPYEKNLEVWRQLWRVCERSNMIIQVIDARNPLLYYTKDLLNYVTKEFPPHGKSMLLLVNKSDLLTDQQRLQWYQYFQQMKIKCLFYSAYLAQEKLDAMTEQELEQEQSPQFDFPALYQLFHEFLQSFDFGIVKEQFVHQKEMKMSPILPTEPINRETQEETIVWGDSEEFTTKINKRTNTVKHYVHGSGDNDESSEEEDEEEEVAYAEGDLEEIGSEELNNDLVSTDDDENDEDEDRNSESSVKDEVRERDYVAEKKVRIFEQRVTSSSGSSKILTRRELLGVLTLLAKVMKDEVEVTENGASIQMKPPTAQNASSLVPNAKSKQRNGQLSSNQTVRPSFGLVGYPNVGKSSVINTLLGVSRSAHGKARVGVSSTPGKTKHFQTLILSPDVMLCDCPGLVFPSIMTSAGEMLCSGILPINHMKDHVEAANLIAARIPSHLLEAAYGMTIVRNLDVLDHPDRPPTGEEVMAAYCQVKGYITNGTGRWDDFRACKEILRDFNDGKILYVAMPPRFDDVKDSSLPAGTDNSADYTREEKEAWLRETEKSVTRNQKIAERIASNRIHRLPLALDQKDQNQNNDEVYDDEEYVEDEENEGVVYEYIEEGEGGDEVYLTEEMGSVSLTGDGTANMVHPNRLKREHKRTKMWGKKGRKLRDKNPYGDTNDIRGYTVHVTNRSRSGVDVVGK